MTQFSKELILFKNAFYPWKYNGTNTIIVCTNIVINNKVRGKHILLAKITAVSIMVLILHLYLKINNFLIS